MAATLTTDEKIKNLGYGGDTERVTDDFSLLTVPYGKLLYNVHDTSLWGNLQCSYPEIEDLAQFVHGLVLDIGANVGSHSIAWASKAEAIYAFEPQPWTYYNLCANLLLNCVSNVTPCQLALGSYNGITNVHAIDPQQAFSTMGVQIDHGTQTAMIRTLDSLGMTDIAFIKIDVEGYEYNVLRGAEETLKRESPIIYVEMHGQEHIDECMPYMASLGYEGHHWRTTLFIENPDDVLNHGYLFYRKGTVTWVDVPS